MKTKKLSDPYLTLIKRFNQYGIDYVVVGMSGINYYARSAAEMFATLDYDVFVKPTIRNVEKSIQCLEDLGFALATKKGPLKKEGLKGVVRDRETLVATTQEGIMAELILRVSGFPFSELAKDAATFTVKGIPVRVGRLNKLIRSKHLANRPKDRQFLQRYKSLLKEK